MICMILRNKTDCAQGDCTNNNTDDKSLFCVSIEILYIVAHTTVDLRIRVCNPMS